MQVPSIPPPVVANTLPQDIAAKAVPSPQAVTPLVQTAVAPTPKAEKFVDARRDRNPKRNNGENQKRDDEDAKEDNHSVNMSI